MTVPVMLPFAVLLTAPALSYRAFATRPHFSPNFLGEANSTVVALRETLKNPVVGADIG